MSTLTINYSVVWELKFAPEYQFTPGGKRINVQRGKELQMKVKGYTRGFYIRGKFRSLTALRKDLIKIRNQEIPF